MAMKIAVAASLQGYPEEYDSDTEDATRIANRAANMLRKFYPTDQIEVFDRTDYPNAGDAYMKVKDDINKWGANIAVHVHQDAGAPGARGFTVIYKNSIDYAVIMNEAMKKVLKPLGVPAHSITPSDGIAVLKIAIPVVLVECGFYTSPYDEAIGTEPYAQSVALGVSNYLIQVMKHYPIGEEKEDDVMIYVLEKKIQQGGQYVWVAPDVFSHLDNIGDFLCYLNVKNESKISASLEVFGTPGFPTNPFKDTLGTWERKSYDIKTLFNVGKDYVGALTVKTDNEGITPSVTILKL